MKIIPDLTDLELVRFWDKVDIQSDDECWLWSAYRDTFGYGTFGIRRAGKQIMYRANRISLFIKTKEQAEIARHSFDNPSCCNPKHLSWGSHQDNMSDMLKRDRHRTDPCLGSKHGRSKIKESDVLEIRASFANGSMTREQIVELYKIGDSTARDIIHRYTWKHI